MGIATVVKKCNKDPKLRKELGMVLNQERKLEGQKSRRKSSIQHLLTEVLRGHAGKSLTSIKGPNVGKKRKNTSGGAFHDPHSRVKVKTGDF